MDAIEIVKVMVRRWIVVVPLVVLGVTASILTASAIPPEYSAKASLIVIGQTGRITGAVLAEAVQDGATRNAVTQQAGGDYRVEAAPEGIVRVFSTADSEADAVAIASSVLDRLGPMLAERSGGLRAAEEVEILNRPTTATQAEEDAPWTAQGSARFLGGEESAFGGGPAAKLLASALAGDEFRQRIQDSGGTAAYEVTTARDVSTVTVEATGTDSESVLLTINEVVAGGNEKLIEIFSLAGQQYPGATVAPLSLPSTTTVDSRGPLRSLVALLGLTAAAAIVAAFVVEHLYQRPSARIRTDLRRPAPSEPYLEGSSTSPAQARADLGSG